MKPIEIAQACYACNREFCRALNDYSLPLWEYAGEEVQRGYLGAVNYHIAHPIASPKESHELWMDSKARAGWKYGPEKDAVKKQHPNMLDYHLLTEEQKLKDIMFKGIVTALSKD